MNVVNPTAAQFNALRLDHGFTPEQEALAREGWKKCGQYFDPTFEEFERKALTEPRITYQLRVWVCCGRTMDKWFAAHPERADSRKKRQLIAVGVVAVSLGAIPDHLCHKGTQPYSDAEEMLALYQETAKEMGLPLSSPASQMEVAPGEYNIMDDLRPAGFRPLDDWEDLPSEPAPRPARPADEGGDEGGGFNPIYTNPPFNK
jgi:hypothetical protein